MINIFVRSLALALLFSLPLLRAIDSKEESVIVTAASVELGNQNLTLKVHRGGAIISDLKLVGGGGDWLAAQPDNDSKLFAHFLCYDRWGGVDEEESAKGIPYHGEAGYTVWNWLERSPQKVAQNLKLPVSGLLAERTVTLNSESSVFSITSRYTNPTAVERVYNAVEHATLSKNGMGDDTYVTTNAEKGFLQLDAREVPDSSFRWPEATYEGEVWDFRSPVRITGGVMATMTFPDEVEWAWICVENKRTREVLGYLWRTADFPWLTLWSYYRDGILKHRAIEPATTGLHRPMSELKAKGSLMDRPLFNRMEPGGSRTHQLWGFVIKLPIDSERVSEVSIVDNIVTLKFEVGNSQVQLLLP